MKFYYCKSACSLAVRIILNELGCVYEEVEVDLTALKTTMESVDPKTLYQQLKGVNLRYGKAFQSI